MYEYLISLYATYKMYDKYVNIFGNVVFVGKGLLHIYNYANESSNSRKKLRESYVDWVLVPDMS